MHIDHLHDIQLKQIEILNETWIASIAAINGHDMSRSNVTA